MTFRTALCDLLGIEYPILQSGMGSVAGSDLVAEVSRAGGLGILAGLRLSPDELRVKIREVRERTDKPFGVNLWLHAELRPPVDVARIPHWKKSLLEREGDATTVTDAFTGQWARTLRNSFEREYRASGAPVLPSLLQSSAARDIYDAAVARRDGEYFPMYSGQSVGLIHDLPGAAEVVEAIVREARTVLADLRQRARTA